MEIFYLDPNAVAIIPKPSIRVIVTGKRVNRNTGQRLVIPVDYFFHGDNRIIE